MSKIIYGGKVIEGEDRSMIGRIRVFPDDEQKYSILNSLKGSTDPKGVPILRPDNEDINEQFYFTKDDPFVFLPLLPLNFNYVPSFGEYVHLFYYNRDENAGRKNQFYVPGPKSSPMNIQYENNLITRGILAQNPNVKQNIEIKNQDGTYADKGQSKGVFAEPKDIGIYSKGRSDIILKDNEILIRAVKSKVLNETSLPIVNQNRSFLQLSYFDKKLSYSPEQTSITPFISNPNIKKLLEYDIYNLNTNGNVFSGNIKIYNLPQTKDTLSLTFNETTEISYNVLVPEYVDEFVGISFDDLILRINETIKGLNQGKITINNKSVFLNSQFPFYYRPGQTLRDGSSQPYVTQEFVNSSSIISKVKFTNSISKKGFDLISDENKVGFLTNFITQKNQDVKVEPKQEGFGVLGGDNLYLISNKSSIPEKPAIQLKNESVYGIPVKDLSLDFPKSTSGLVRADELKELLNLMLQYITTHKHAWHLLPPEETSYSGVKKNEIITEFGKYDSKVANQFIRIN